MKQFVTSNVIALEMVVPGLFTKEQVFAMCEELRKMSFYGKVIYEVKKQFESYGNDVVDTVGYRKHVIDKVKHLLIEIGEGDMPYGEKLKIYDESIKVGGYDDDTIQALNSIYPVMSLWQSKDIDDLIKYYKIVLHNFSALEFVLPKYLYHDVIKVGLEIICKHMGFIKENIMGEYGGKINDKNEPIILLYPEGLVSAEYYYSLHNNEDKSIFEVLAKINPGRYREPNDNAYTDATLAKELLARKFVEEGKYICKDDSIHYPDDDENDDADESEIPMHDDLYIYCSSDDRERMMGQETERALDRIRKEIESVTNNIDEVLGIDLKIDTTADMQQRMESIVAKMVFHKYSRFFMETNNGKGNNVKMCKKDIFHILKCPSYENSISGLMNDATENWKILFYAKSDLLRHSLKNKEIHDKMLEIDESVPLPYLHFVESVERVKKLFRFDGLKSKASFDMNNELFLSLREKRLKMHRLKMEFYNLYDEYYRVEGGMGILESIYFRLIEHEYIGIIRDLKMMYAHMGKWLSKISNESVEYLLDKQMQIDDGELVTKNFDFVKEIRKYKKDISIIIGADDIGKSGNEISRYADRYYDMWSTMLELYPKKRWGQNNYAYADLGTMVALVQVEAMLRKKKIKFQYGYSYKGDAGKNMTLSNYKNAYMNKTISKYVVMDLLSWQILCNFGFSKSVKQAIKIIIRLCRTYEELYKENVFRCFVERAQGLEFDENLFTDREIVKIHHELRKYCAEDYAKARSEMKL